MTRTEDRLADALRAAARDGQEVRLRPLVVPARARHQWMRRLAPAGAAAAVALIVTAAVLLTGGRQASPPSQAVPPRFYVVDEQAHFVVRATATGAVTDRIPNPVSTALGTQLINVAAGDRGREFIVEYSRQINSGDRIFSQTLLYSFHLTNAGHATGLRMVRGGTIRDFAVYDNALAVSPDGTKVAVAVFPCSSRAATPGVSSGCSGQMQIVVVNLRTGTHSVWQGGLQRSGLDLSIPSISWASSTSLAFLGQWSNLFTARTGPYRNYQQVRTLDLTAGGGSLAQGHVLLRSSTRYPDITQAQLGPGGASIIIEVALPIRHGRTDQDFQVITVPLAGSGQPRLVYQGLVFGNDFAPLRSDASGRYLLILGQTKNGNGWIDHGKLHLLPPQWAAAEVDAW